MRVAPHTRLAPGKESECERVHAVISGELDIALRDAGVSSWRIDHSGDDSGQAPVRGLP
jgi:L-rhamnose mutarotase